MTRLLVLLLLSAFAPTSTEALPRYASRQGATCNTCHHDPNGGGIRNEFGFEFLKNRHEMQSEERWESLTVSPKLNDWVQIGLDTRVLYYLSHEEGGPTVSSSTFFPMQGQVNVAVTPHERLTLVASHGLVVDEPGFPTGYVARELYGIFEGLPGQTYMRAGRFRIPFGLRQDDHTSFVRSMPFLPYDSQKSDAGIELGHVGSKLFAHASFTNGSTPFFERAQTFAAKVGRATERYQAGVSGFHQFGEVFALRHDRWAVYASTTIGELTLLGEYAGGTTEAATGTTNLTAFFAEANYRLGRGVNLRAKFDRVDPDRGTAGGATNRYSGEIDITPVPFSEIRLTHRFYEREGAGEIGEYTALLYFPF